GDFKDSTNIKVHLDPRLKITATQLEQKEVAINDFNKIVNAATESFNQLKAAKKTIKLVNDQMVNAPDSLKKQIKKLGKAMTDSITQMQLLYVTPQDAKGITRSDDRLNSKLFTASRYIGGSDGKPGQMAQFATAHAKERLEEVLEKVNKFFAKDWKDYQEKAEAARTSIFKDFEEVKIED
ncbi:MAG: hypothetical protein AAF573_12590, partial [Bacteroidota bacterium]